MRNRKSGNEEMGRRHIQQTADVLLLQSSNVMRKSMSIHALIDIILACSWHQRGMHCITVCKLVLYINVFFWQCVRYIHMHAPVLFPCYC